MDEPTSGLDPKTTQESTALVQGLGRECQLV
jgi:ABC-type transporter Mla maintaining outer membrane lipid asymmetry ATPase subunit MlaF